jgi:hypothetical protein
MQPNLDSSARQLTRPTPALRRPAPAARVMPRNSSSIPLAPAHPPAHQVLQDAGVWHRVGRPQQLPPQDETDVGGRRPGWRHGPDPGDCGAWAGQGWGPIGRAGRRAAGLAGCWREGGAAPAAGPQPSSPPPACPLPLFKIVSGFTGVVYIDLWSAAILTAAAMMLVGCLNTSQALTSIDWTVYITVAFAFGVSRWVRGSPRQLPPSAQPLRATRPARCWQSTALPPSRARCCTPPQRSPSCPVLPA